MTRSDYSTYSDRRLRLAVMNTRVTGLLLGDQRRQVDQLGNLGDGGAVRDEVGAVADARSISRAGRSRCRWSRIRSTRTSPGPISTSLTTVSLATGLAPGT